MFLTRASAVATRSNRPPCAFSTAPAKPHDRPEPSATASARHFLFLTRRPNVRPQTLPSIARVFGIIIIVVFVVVTIFYRTAGARPADTGDPHVTVFDPFVPRGDGRPPSRLQSTVVHEHEHTHVYCHRLCLSLYCYYHHHHRRH